MKKATLYGQDAGSYDPVKATFYTVEDITDPNTKFVNKGVRTEFCKRYIRMVTNMATQMQKWRETQTVGNQTIAQGDIVICVRWDAKTFLIRPTMIYVHQGLDFQIVGVNTIRSKMEIEILARSLDRVREKP